eukprot:229477-Chlamydomonas_euryale.AAC.4
MGVHCLHVGPVPLPRGTTVVPRNLPGWVGQAFDGSLCLWTCVYACPIICDSGITHVCIHHNTTTTASPMAVCPAATCCCTAPPSLSPLSMEWTVGSRVMVGWESARLELVASTSSLPGVPLASLEYI